MKSGNKKIIEKLTGKSFDDDPMNEKLAELIYEAYCVKTGGKAFNGDPIPGWIEFRSDPKKKIQSDAWITAAEAARTFLTP